MSPKLVFNEDAVMYDSVSVECPLETKAPDGVYDLYWAGSTSKGVIVKEGKIDEASLQRAAHQVYLKYGDKNMVFLSEVRFCGKRFMAEFESG